MRVRGSRDSAEFARVQPVHQTAFTRVDGQVPGPSVKMTHHQLLASRAVEDSLAWILPTRWHSSRAFFVGTCGVNDQGETIHLDEHAETARAIEEWMAIKPGR